MRTLLAHKFARFLAYLFLVLASVWATTALALDLPLPRLRLAVAAVYAVAVVFLLLRRKLIPSLVCFVVVLAWWLSLKPSNAGQWQLDVSRPAYADIQGDNITIHNLRICDYRAELDYTCEWITRNVNLNDVEGVDLFMDYWGSPLIAHTILSFEVRGQQPISFSIETRKQGNQTYSALRGFFRQYTLISVVSEEQDVIRVRSNYRHGEDLYLFHTTATPAFAQSLFLNYLGLTNRLRDHPAWYNALTHNCTTEIYTLKSMQDQPLDWRILLNGKGDQMLYERGLLATGGLTFQQLKKQAWINPAAQAANHDPDFSARIRQNRAGF
jgi:hypothetical protein